VFVTCLRFFSYGLANADVGAGCTDVTIVETAGLRGALGAMDLGFLIGSLLYFCCDKTTRNRNPEDLYLRTLSTELEVSKDRLFIRQVEWRVRSWVEPVPPLKVMDD
nr:hypothetical protein [Tanacetum cinerariifolium]